MLSNISNNKISISAGGQMNVFIDRDEWIRIVVLGYHLGWGKPAPPSDDKGGC